MRKYVIFLLIINSFLLLGAALAIGANHFIRPGPNGGTYGNEDGSDWNNAYDGFPDMLVRGDTYYISGGEYNMYRGSTVYEFDDTESGTTYLYIKKASVDGICDQTAGWQSSFGTDQAVLYNSTYYIATALRFTKGYYDFDGITGSGTSDHGILIKTPDYREAITAVWLVWPDTNLSNINFKHITFQAYPESTNPDVCSQLHTWSTANSVYQYCYFKDFGEAISLGSDTSGVTIENCYFGDSWQSTNCHGNVLDITCNDDLVVRYNTFANNGASAILSIHGKMSDIECSSDNVEIYGNLFNNRSITPEGPAIGSVTPACTQGADSWKIYNNTFIVISKIYMPQRDGTCTGYENTWPATNWEVKNNLVYGTGQTWTDGGGTTGITYAYQYWNNYTDPYVMPDNATNRVVSAESVDVLFRNYNGDNFKIGRSSEAKNLGADLGTSYNTDKDGNGRGKDGTWDIGAYEYVPPPPNNFRQTSP